MTTIVPAGISVELSADPELTADSKQDIAPVEEVDYDNGPKIGDGPGLLKSRFDELGAWKTVWIFRRSVWFVFVLTTMNMLDGWQVGDLVCQVLTPDQHRREHHREQRLHQAVWSPSLGRKYQD